MTATRAFAKTRVAWRDVEGVAANAVKRGFTALQFEAMVIAAIIVKPRTEKDSGDQQAVNDGGGGEYEHD